MSSTAALAEKHRTTEAEMAAFVASHRAARVLIAARNEARGTETPPHACEFCTAVEAVEVVDEDLGPALTADELRVLAVMEALCGHNDATVQGVADLVGVARSTARRWIDLAEAAGVVEEAGEYDVRDGLPGQVVMFYTLACDESHQEFVGRAAQHEQI
jgi:hypothetical protein